MSEAIEKALSKLPPRPWRIEKVDPSEFQKRGYTIKPGDDDIGAQTGFEVGAIRSITGQNVIEPWPESASMVIAIPGVLDALVALVNSVDEESKR